jgi:hypothetical protein
MDFITEGSDSDDAVEVGSASDPQEVNTLTSDAEDVGSAQTPLIGPTSRPDAYLVEEPDDDFKVDMTAEFSVPLEFTQNRLYNYDTRQSSKSWRWKGIDWTILLVMQPHGKGIGLFVGFDEPRQLPNNKHLNIKFQFQLVDANGGVVYEGNPLASAEGNAN